VGVVVRAATPTLPVDEVDTPFRAVVVVAAAAIKSGLVLLLVVKAEKHLGRLVERLGLVGQAVPVMPALIISEVRAAVEEEPVVPMPVERGRPQVVPEVVEVPI